MLFNVAVHCAAYHRTFALIYPTEARSGAMVNHPPELRPMFNALLEATLMFVRKSAEFFKPQSPNDRDDTLHSYQYPGYTGQCWIVPQKTYVEFHKRVGHLTLQEVRQGKVLWPVFELALQAMNQWAHFFEAMAAAYATAPETATYCADSAREIRSKAGRLEQEALRSLERPASGAAEGATTS